MEVLYFIGGLVLGLLVGAVALVVLSRGSGAVVELGTRFIEGLRVLVDSSSVGSLTASRGDESWGLSIRGYDKQQRPQQQP